ncbi:MAG: hypothetical protein V1747_01335 [Candidatus Omnitrophota bacterium]
MYLMLLAFMVPVVCATLVLVTTILKIIKRISLQIDQLEIKILDLEAKIR